MRARAPCAFLAATRHVGGRDIDLFQLAFGLVPPWMVVDAKFDANKKRFDIEIDFKTGGRFVCSECG